MLAMNTFRAIENHVAIARTAPTGISAIIEPDGRVSARVEDGSRKEVEVEGYVVREVPLSSTRTFYTRYGGWLLPALAALFLSLLAGASPLAGLVRR